MLGNDANALEMKVWQDNLCPASKSALYFSILKFKRPIVESKTLSSVKCYSFLNNKFYIGYIINQDKKKFNRIPYFGVQIKNGWLLMCRRHQSKYIFWAS